MEVPAVLVFEDSEIEPSLAILADGVDQGVNTPGCRIRTNRRLFVDATYVRRPQWPVVSPAQLGRMSETVEVPLAVYVARFGYDSDETVVYADQTPERSRRAMVRWNDWVEQQRRLRGGKTARPGGAAPRASASLDGLDRLDFSRINKLCDGVRGEILDFLSESMDVTDSRKTAYLSFWWRLSYMLDAVDLLVRGFDPPDLYRQTRDWPELMGVIASDGETLEQLAKLQASKTMQLRTDAPRAATRNAANFRDIVAAIRWLRREAGEIVAAKPVSGDGAIGRPGAVGAVVVTGDLSDGAVGAVADAAEESAVAACVE